jgi:hypothetical protein
MQGDKMGAFCMIFWTLIFLLAMAVPLMATNPLAVNLAGDALGQAIRWGRARLVPGVICMVSLRLIWSKLYRPKVKNVPAPPVNRCARLSHMPFLADIWIDCAAPLGPAPPHIKRNLCKHPHCPTHTHRNVWPQRGEVCMGVITMICHIKEPEQGQRAGASITTSPFEIFGVVFGQTYKH